jgi:hypothetical protein
MYEKTVEAYEVGNGTDSLGDQKVICQGYKNGF